MYKINAVLSVHHPAGRLWRTAKIPQQMLHNIDNNESFLTSACGNNHVLFSKFLNEQT
jgi:hypothetical protein